MKRFVLVALVIFFSAFRAYAFDYPGKTAQWQFVSEHGDSVIMFFTTSTQKACGSEALIFIKANSKNIPMGMLLRIRDMAPYETYNNGCFVMFTLTQVY